MNNVYIGGNTISWDNPQVVGVGRTDNTVWVAGRNARDLGADLFEFRVDKITYSTRSMSDVTQDIEEALIEFKDHCDDMRAFGIPMIGTIRRMRDNGLFIPTTLNDIGMGEGLKSMFKGRLSDRRMEKAEEERLEIFKVLVKYVDAVDIELDTPIRDEVIGMALDNDVTPIVSYHNCLNTPSIEDIQSKYDEMRETEGKVFKLAYMATDQWDVIKLLKSLVDFHKHGKPVSVTAMGEIGKISKVVFPLFGSALTYGSLSNKKEPGEMYVKELKWTMALLKHDIPAIREAMETGRMPESFVRLNELFNPSIIQSSLSDYLSVS